jgi:DNA replication licensing factor MCM5
MDRQPTYSLSLFGDAQSTNGEQTNKQIQQELVDFILDFHLDNVFIYRYASEMRARQETTR